MKPLTPILLSASLTLLLASCGQTPQTSALPATTASSVPELQAQTIAHLGSLSAQAVASTIYMAVGQTRQITVYVSGQPAQPGQLVWTTSNAGVVSVTQSGLITARTAGTATVRAALASNTAAFIDFPIVVTTSSGSGGGSTTPSGTFAQRVLTLTNQARAQARTCGTTSYAAAPALTYNALLEKAAQGHATDMASKNYFSHTSQDGRTFAQRITATGYTWTRIAENIAAGQSTPETVVSGWLSSAGHCANIMNPNLKEIGIGYAYNASSSYGHYWVQDFGTR